VEDPTFSLVRHLPRDEQCDGSFWLGIWPATFMVNHSEIERFIHWSGSSLGVPSYFWRSPKYDWWSGNGREVNEGFCALLAKRAKPVIRPSTVGQAIGSPNPILNSKPRKKKNLTFGGAQALHTLLSMLEDVEPKNCTSYADLPEYWPLSMTIQTMPSSTSGSRWILLRRVQSSTNWKKCVNSDGLSNRLGWRFDGLPRPKLQK
jgi:hypothetical protein